MPDELELLDDGQEEVFSRTAIERGMDKVPLALGPDRRQADEDEIAPMLRACDP